MRAKFLITEEIPPLKTSVLGGDALVFMNEFNVSHLPIVNNTQFLGLISEHDIIDLNEPDSPIGDHSLSLIKPVVFMDQHIYEVINLVARLKLTIIPVVDSEYNYRGVITLNSIVENLSNLSSIKDPGGIVILEMGYHDYSLTEISRLVESEDLKILSISLDADATRRTLQLTLKLNKTNIKHIVATFERFNYKVLSTFMEEEQTDSLKDRYDILMKYLDM
jgi:CBS domain-containing protein